MKRFRAGDRVRVTALYFKNVGQTGTVVDEAPGLKLVRVKMDSGSSRIRVFFEDELNHANGLDVILDLL